MSVSQTSSRHQPEQATTPKGSPPSRLLSSEAEQRIQQAGRDAIAGRPPVAAAKTYGGYKFVAVVIILGGVTGVVAGAVLSQPVLIVAGAIGAVVGLLLLIKASKAATKASTAHTAAVQQAAGEAARVRARQQEEANRKAEEARIAEERAAKAIADAAEQARIADQQRKAAETLKLAAQQAQTAPENAEAEAKANAEADVGRSKNRSDSSSRSNSLTSGSRPSENLGETPSIHVPTEGANTPLSSPTLQPSIPPSRRSASLRIDIGDTNSAQASTSTAGSAGLPPRPQSTKSLLPRRNSAFTTPELTQNEKGTFVKPPLATRTGPSPDLTAAASVNPPHHNFTGTLRRTSHSSQPSTPTASSDVATETSSTATTAGATSSETVFPVVKLNAVEPSARSDLRQGSLLLVNSPQLSGAIPIVTVEPKDTAAIVAPVQGVATPKAGDPVSSDGIVSTTPTTTTTTTATTTTTTIATTTTEAAPRAMLPARNTPASETPEPQKPINMVIRRVSDGGTLDTNRQEQASTGQIAAQASLFGPTVFDKKKTEGQ